MPMIFNQTIVCLSIGTALFSSCVQKDIQEEETSKRPNILIALSDDQSYPHASAYGSRMVSTPAFDRVAQQGILFNNAFVASPGCAPSRAALLTGLNPWQLEESGTHASSFPAHYRVYPDLLEEVGYYIGYTHKAWGPGDWEVSGRDRNPAGIAYNFLQLNRWPAGDPQELLADGTLGAMHHAYYDIDACPTQDFLVANHDHPEYGKYLQLAVAKRPAEELFDIVNDPYCVYNLAGDPAYQADLHYHRELLGGYLMKTNDPRVTGDGEIFESYPRLRGAIRNFPKKN